MVEIDGVIYPDKIYIISQKEYQTAVIGKIVSITKIVYANRDALYMLGSGYVGIWFPEEMEHVSWITIERYEKLKCYL